jgi:hypothetical protein
MRRIGVIMHASADEPESQARLAAFLQPAIYEWREFTQAGGLASYGTNPARMSRRTPPKKPAKSWRVIIMRSRGEHLGTVEAPDRERAEVVAVNRRRSDGGGMVEDERWTCCARTSPA